MKRKIRINTCKRLNVRYNLTINDIHVITFKYYFGNYLKLSVNDEESDFSVVYQGLRLYKQERFI